MTPPKGSSTTLINIYLHHKGNQGSGVDVFNDDWGQGVGTDKYGMPWIGEPMPLRTAAVNSYPYLGFVHEVFHIMQYYGTTVDRTFPYDDIGRWYVEGTANYFQSYNCEKLTTSVNNSFLSDTPAFLFNPQLSLWYKPQDNNASWSRGVHAYGAQIFFNYLTWKNYITEDFVGKSFGSKTKLTPVEYLLKTIPDFTNVYRDFAMKASVLDFPYYKAAITYWMQNWGSTVAYSPSKINLGDVNTYAFSLVDTSTNGFVRPKEKNEAWSYTTTKIVNTKKASYRIQFKADSLGSAKTPSNYYIGVVYQSTDKSSYQNVTNYKDVIDRPMYVGQSTYSTIQLINGKCDTTVVADDNTSIYLVAVSTPKVFTGSEIFDYEVSITRNAKVVPPPPPDPIPDTIPKPKPSKEEYIRMGPNPCSDHVKIFFELEDYKTVNVDIIQIATGVRVVSKKEVSTKEVINLSQIPSGAYVAIVTSSDGKMYKYIKLVKAD
jgi:hypothetical protein